MTHWAYNFTCLKSHKNDTEESVYDLQLFHVQHDMPNSASMYDLVAIHALVQMTRKFR